MLETRRLLASDFQLVKDINTTTNLQGSNPSAIVSVGNTIFFTQSTPGFGEELWKTDGTDAGTVMVKDINPGGASGNEAASTLRLVAWDLTNVNGELYFAASNGVNGQELWKSDGTPGGTCSRSRILFRE